MNFLRTFGNQRQIGRILSNRNIKRLHKASMDHEPLASVILYSPKNLDSLVSSQNWVFDFQPVYNWLSSTTHFNLKKAIDSADEVVTEEKFEESVKVAFNTLLDPKFRSQSDPETVLFYYTGHGLEPSSEEDEYSHSPNFPHLKLDDVGITKEILERATKYIKPERPLKGGEFCLHKFGDWDLENLLGLWTTGLTKSSTKKNKHLIVIADSCYSGVLVEDLEKLKGTCAPWNENGCTVTVQSASGSDEKRQETYFSECFVHFNKPENRESLQNLKEKWNRMPEDEKNNYRGLSRNLPSPQVATTSPLDKSSSNVDRLTIEFSQISGQGFSLTLFRDAEFYKFCYFTRVMKPLLCDRAKYGEVEGVHSDILNEPIN